MQKEIRHRGGPVAGQAIRSTTSTDDEDSNSKALRTPEPSAWGVRDWPYFIAVFVIAMFTRFYRLTEPAGVVFDEVCFRLCTILGCLPCESLPFFFTGALRQVHELVPQTLVLVRYPSPAGQTDIHGR